MSGRLALDEGQQSQQRHQQQFIIVKISWHHIASLRVIQKLVTNPLILDCELLLPSSCKKSQQSTNVRSTLHKFEIDVSALMDNDHYSMASNHSAGSTRTGHAHHDQGMIIADADICQVPDRIKY